MPSPTQREIKFRAFGEEIKVATVNKGEEVTLYWLMTGQTARCEVSLPSGKETVSEEGTRKIVVDSDFVFEVNCAGNNSGMGIKNSVDIKIK